MTLTAVEPGWRETRRNWGYSGGVKRVAWVARIVASTWVMRVFHSRSAVSVRG